MSNTNTKNIGLECLRNVIVEQQPSHCHEWTGPSAKGKHDFSEALQAANNVLYNAGVHPLHGISKEKENHIVDNLPRELNRLRAYATVNGITLTVEQFKAQLHEYIKCVNGRAPTIRTMLGDKDWDPLAVELALTEENVGMWGSRRQYACGRTISRLLFKYQVTEIELHPVFAVMLNPTGGMAGWGNWVFYVGDLHDSVNIHAVVHDAFGYMTQYHKKGPGYNYLETWTLFWSSFPLCCQPQGYWLAHKIMKQSGLHGLKGRLNRARFIVKEMTRTMIPGPDMDTVEAAEAVLRTGDL